MGRYHMSIYHSYRGSIITDCALHLGRETIFSFLFETRLTFRQKLPQKVWMGVVFVLYIMVVFVVNKKISSHILPSWGMGRIIILGKLTLTNMLVS